MRAAFSLLAICLLACAAPPPPASPPPSASAAPGPAPSHEPPPDLAASPEPPPAIPPPAVPRTARAAALLDPRLVAARDAIATGGSARAKLELLAILATSQRDGPIDVTMSAAALAGRAAVSLGDRREAAKHFQTAVDAWKREEARSRAVPADDAGRRALGRSLDALGEALFFFAEEKRLAAAAITLPRSKGTSEGFRRAMVDYLREQRRAVDEAEAAYRKIVDITPFPPPRWTVDSASRVGELWSAIADSVRAAPFPPEWLGDGPAPGGGNVTRAELRAAFRAQLDEAAAPATERARAAYRTCRALAEKLAVEDELTVRCDDWVARDQP